MGAFSFAKDWIKQHIQAPDDYISMLGWADPLLRRHWLWPADRLLHRLHSLIEFAEWKIGEWDHFEAVAHARRRFKFALRELIAARLLDPPEWEDRRRLNMTLSRLEYDLQISHVKCYPWRAYLELANQCNLRCQMCPQSILTFDRRLTDRAIIDNATRIISWITLLDLTGFGETLLNPMFPDALAIAGPHTTTRVITNGLLLRDEIAKTVVEHQLNELNISIDAATPETYLKQRHNKGFPVILRNIRRVVERKQQTGSVFPVLSFHFTMMRRNAHELPEVLRLAKQLGMQRVHANMLVVYRKELVEQSLFYDQELANRTIDECTALAHDLGIAFQAPEKFSLGEPAPPPPHKNCADPWEFIQFRAAGDASACCLSAGTFGDLSTQPVEEVWFSDEYARFRHRVNHATESPLLCAQCHYGRPTSKDDPRMHFYIRELEIVRDGGEQEYNDSLVRDA